MNLISGDRGAATRILVTGATGYIGGRLVPWLLEAGYSVRCLVRAPRKLEHREWSRHPRVEIVAGDVGDVEATTAAARGCDAAFYLVHSMLVAGDAYSDRDRALARTFAEAIAAAGVGRIVYLGGLGETGNALSEHLSSRREVESVLRSTGVPVTVLRAAMIIGAGSASFEILRYLVERLPVMLTPRWVHTRCQPVAVRNVLHALVECLRVPETIGETLDLGGPDVVTYRELMRIMAEERGLPKRRVIPIPVLTPRLSSLWIHLITPISRNVARPLAEGLRNELLCRDDRANRLMPQEMLSVREAIRRALRNVREDRVETRWADAGPIPGDPDWAGGDVFEDAWTIEIRADARDVFDAVCRVGGGHGWYAADWLWRIRGWMDRLVGGPGLRRGRRHAARIGYGDALDFWRVTHVEEPRRLELRAEMKLPGLAQLAFEIAPAEGAEGVVRLTQTARFIPRGLGGLAYWYAVQPLHGVVFRGMLEGIRRCAEEPFADAAGLARAEGGSARRVRNRVRGS